MKVLLIRAGAIDPSVNKMAISLSKMGFNTTLLVWDRQNTINHEKICNYQICRFKFKAPYNKYRIVLYLPFWWLYELYFLLREDCDIVHACDLDTLLPAILAKFIKNFKLCYTIYDFYALNFSDGQPSLIKKLLEWITAILEKKGIGFVDALFLVNECRLNDVKGAKIKSVTYIYNTPHDYFNKISQSIRKTDELIIFYAGILLKTRGIEDIITSLDDIKGVKLILAGDCPEKDLMKKIAFRSDKIEYLGVIPYDEVIRITFNSDLLFRFSDPEIHETKCASPNKLYEAMMCGKPIIVSNDSSMADIVRKDNCGIVVKYGDIAAIKNAIIKLKEDLIYRMFLGTNARIAYETKYSWDIMERRLFQTYIALMNSNKD